MNSSKLKIALVSVLLLSGLILSAEQADDSLIIESEEALARSHAIQMDTAELERKNTEVELETKQAIAEASKGINQAKSDEAKYAQLATKYAKSIATLRAHAAKLKEDEKKTTQKAFLAERKMKENEKTNTTVSSNVEKQKAKNDELKNKLASLNTRSSELQKEIKKLQRQFESQKQKKQIYKNRIASADAQVKKLSAKRSAAARLVR